MSIARTTVTTIALSFALAAGQAAAAGEYRVLAKDAANACQSGTKTDWMTLEGPDEIRLAHADRDRINAAVCVAEDSRSAVHLRWKADGSWKSSGTISHGCAEILGASKVKLRAVNTNFQERATYYTCVQQ